MLPRLKERYLKEVVPNMMKEFSYENIMEVPKIDKIVLNVGLGEAYPRARLHSVSHHALHGGSRAIMRSGIDHRPRTNRGAGYTRSDDPISGS